MSRYKIFLLLFITSIIAFIIFFIFYIKVILGFMIHADDFSRHGSYQSPFEFFSTIFTPGVIISFVVMTLCSLAARILGIVSVVKNKLVSDGEKALWVIGFIMMGFVTAILFLILAKGKKFVD